jgi:hypothetical protein
MTTSGASGSGGEFEAAANAGPPGVQTAGLPESHRMLLIDAFGRTAGLIR